MIIINDINICIYVNLIIYFLHTLNNNSSISENHNFNKTNFKYIKNMCLYQDLNNI